MKKEECSQLYMDLRMQMQERWNRTLPFGELLVDRWEKARFLQFGEESSIYDSSIVMGRVAVGAHTWIGPGTLLDGTGGILSIGSYCDISAGVQIYTHDTVKRCLSGGRLPVEKADVKIGDCCYIAPGSLIVKGVSIGRCSVVAAQSFVKDSFGDYAIIAGTPAVQVGEVIIKDDDVELRYFHVSECKQ